MGQNIITNNSSREIRIGTKVIKPKESVVVHSNCVTLLGGSSPINIEFVHHNTGQYNYSKDLTYSVEKDRRCIYLIFADSNNRLIN